MLPLSELPFASALTVVTRAAHRAARRPFQIPVHHLRRRSGKQGLSVPAGQGPWSRMDADPGTGVPPWTRTADERLPGRGSIIPRAPIWKIFSSPDNHNDPAYLTTHNCARFSAGGARSEAEQRMQPAAPPVCRGMPSCLRENCGGRRQDGPVGILRGSRKTPCGPLPARSDDGGSPEAADAQGGYAIQAEAPFAHASRAERDAQAVDVGQRHRGLDPASGPCPPPSPVPDRHCPVPARCGPCGLRPGAAHRRTPAHPGALLP